MTAIRIAKKLSSMVAGKRARKMSKASRPGRTPVEAPKLPVRARFK
jgi:hypothetical protein